MSKIAESVVATVVTHNRKAQLRTCLEAICAQEGAACDVLVIDNGSTDGTGAMVREEFGTRGVRHFDVGANTGSAGGFHLCAYAGVTLGYDLIWIMDDDVVPSKTALRELLAAGRTLRGAWGFLSSVAVWKDGTPCRANIQKKGLLTFVSEADYRRDVVPVRMAAMASLLLRADVVRDVGLPLAEYFFYSDDYEYTARVSDHYPCYLVPASRVVHDMARNAKARLATEVPDRLWRYRYLYRNDVHLYRRYGCRGWAYLAAKTGWTTLDVLLHERHDRCGKLRVLWAGIEAGLRFQPTIVYPDDESPHASSAKRVLIWQEAWGLAGIESFVMSLLRNVDPTEFEIELLSAYDWHDGYDDEIRRLGATRSAVYPGRMPGHLARLLAGTRAWRRRLRQGDVDVVHVNAMNGLTLAYVAIAKSYGVPVRIAHAHNTSFAGGTRLLKQALHATTCAAWGDAATARLACSQAAGRYLFGERSFTFVPNGIDAERFRFDASERMRVRDELNVAEGAFVFGSLGRLSYQKNPLFAVDVLAELTRRGIDARLLLIGDGELEEGVADRVAGLGLQGRYIHLPSVGNPEAYYCAMDAFLLPSVFEGSPFSLLEAQCSGLLCVVSEAIQDEVCVTDLVRRVGLGAGAPAWCDLLLQAWGEPHERTAFADCVARAGFSATAGTEVVRAVWSSGPAHSPDHGG